MTSVNSMVNMTLARQQNRTITDIIKIHCFQQHRESLEKQMKDMNPETDVAYLRHLKYLWVQNELDLQEAWGFALDTSYHKEFLLPHCTCPIYDNLVMVGSDVRYRNKNCIYHGEN